MADKQSKNPFMDMFNDFGSSMKIPGADMSSLMEGHAKNIQALQEAVQVSTSSAQSAMETQRAALEKTLADISETVQKTAGSSDPAGAMATSVDLAKKTFDATVQTTKDMAEIMQQGNTQSFEVLKARVMETVEELTPKSKS